MYYIRHVTQLLLGYLSLTEEEHLSWGNRCNGTTYVRTSRSGDSVDDVPLATHRRDVLEVSINHPASELSNYTEWRQLEWSWKFEPSKFEPSHRPNFVDHPGTWLSYAHCFWAFYLSLTVASWSSYRPGNDLMINCTCKTKSTLDFARWP